MSFAYGSDKAKNKRKRGNNLLFYEMQIACIKHNKVRMNINRVAYKIVQLYCI